MLSGDGLIEQSSYTSAIEEAAASCGICSSAAQAAAWAIRTALPLSPQPPPLLPRSMQLLCVVIKNICSWLDCAPSYFDDFENLYLFDIRLQALADSVNQPLIDGLTSRSAPLPLLPLLQASSDCSALKKMVLTSVEFHFPNVASSIIVTALAPCLASLSASGSNLFAAAAQLASENSLILDSTFVIATIFAGGQLSELMVSVRSIAISFRQSRCGMSQF
jgi:hypothetical protein